MSSQIPNWLFRLCERKQWKLLPGRTDVWVDIKCIAYLMRSTDEKYVQRKLKGIPRHPRCSGVVRFSDLESVMDDNGEET